jgi:sugar/nucleoside kinase (ribokinase family)
MSGPPTTAAGAAPVVVVVGDVVNDVVVRPLGPVAAGTDTPCDIVRLPGGQGANQAAWLGVLGVPVRFVSRVGASDAAQHRADLASAGVEVRFSEDAEHATGTVVVIVSGRGERSMFTARGASRHLGAEDLGAEVLEGAALLHVSGYQLFEEPSRSAVRRLWARALAAGLPTSVDPASVASLAAVGPTNFLQWASGGRLVFPNLAEGRLLTGCDEPDAIVEALLDSFSLVALKLGPDGALAGSADGRRVRLGAAPTEVVDSTGAGDAFAGGFLAGWLAGADLAECTARAVATAARAVGRIGGRPSSAAGSTPP